MLVLLVIVEQLLFVSSIHYCDCISLIPTIVFNLFFNRNNSNECTSHNKVKYILTSNFNDDINVGQGNSRYTTTASSTMNNETAFLCTPMNDEVSSNDYYRANHTTSFNPNQHCRQSSTSRSTRSLPRSVNEITPNYYVNERSDIVSATKRNNEYNNEYPRSCTSR